MNVNVIEVDSKVFGKPVLEIENFDSLSDLISFEKIYIKTLNPFYVSCKIPLEDLHAIHKLEEIGFNLIECQIKSNIKLKKLYDVSMFNNYTFEKVTCEKNLAEIINISKNTFVHDRFNVDAKIPKELASKRYQEYIVQSFYSKNDSVFSLKDNTDNKIVAFKTHRQLTESHMLLLLGGVHLDYKGLGIGAINEYYEFNYLIRHGIKKATTHISAVNYPIFNMEIGKLGFRVEKVFAVMRKIYN
ncbi:MAG: hypothetical protein V4525_09310 [Pseudomonadota bacterium]